MDDILEHLDNPLRVIEECYCLLKKGGTLRLKVVYWNHKYSFSDFTHKHAFSEISFNCLVGRGRPIDLEFCFSEMKIDYIFNPRAITKYRGLDLTELSYWMCNIIQAMDITLIK